jgi:hypothetical protein
MLFIFTPIDKEVFKVITHPRIQQDMYLISNFGRVYSMHRRKFLKPRIDKDGYYRIGLRANSEKYKKTIIGIHRLVAWEFCDGYDEEIGKIIPNHLNSDPSDNHFNNLEWCTKSENAAYSYSNYGYHKVRCGEKSNFSIYTEYDIRKVCELAEKGFSRKDISKITGVNKHYIGDIFRGKKWKHITKDYNLPKSKRIISFKGFSDSDKKKILKLLKKGYKPKEICNKLNIEYNKTHKIAITNLRKKL